MIFAVVLHTACKVRSIGGVAVPSVYSLLWVWTQWTREGDITTGVDVRSDHFVWRHAPLDPRFEGQDRIVLTIQRYRRHALLPEIHRPRAAKAMVHARYHRETSELLNILQSTVRANHLLVIMAPEPPDIRGLLALGRRVMGEPTTCRVLIQLPSRFFPFACRCGSVTVAQRMPALPPPTSPLRYCAFGRQHGRTCGLSSWAIACWVGAGSSSKRLRGFTGIVSGSNPGLPG